MICRRCFSKIRSKVLSRCGGHRISGYNFGLGGLAERLNAPVLKTGKALRPSWVRIPRPPPANTTKSREFKGLRDFSFLSPLFSLSARSVSTSELSCRSVADRREDACLLPRSGVYDTGISTDSISLNASPALKRLSGKSRASVTTASTSSRYASAARSYPSTVSISNERTVCSLRRSSSVTAGLRRTVDTRTETARSCSRERSQ